MKYRTIVADPPWPIGDFPAWFKEQRRSSRERALGHNPTPYQTMTLDDIKAMPVASISEPEAHLYLWTINDHLEASFAVARAWGFQPSATLVWCKRPMGNGMGGKFAGNVEFVLFCRERHGAVQITSYLADCAREAGLTTRDVNRAMGTSDMAGWWLSRLPHRARIPTWEQWQQLKALVHADDRFDEDVRLVNDNRRDDERCDTRWFEWKRGFHSAKPDAFLDLVERVSPGPYAELFARRARFGWDYPIGDQALGGVAA